MTKLRILWYTRPSIKPYLGFLLMMGGFLGLMAFLHSRGRMDETAWAIFRLVGSGVILAVLLPWFGGCLRILRVFRQAGREDRLNALCEDFEQAKVIAKGYARLGKGWSFGKGGQNVVAYKDIRSVHLHEHYAGLQRNQRELHYTDHAGKEHPLCGLPLFGKKGETLGNEIRWAVEEQLREVA